jgi:filamentous hemagglutinin
MSPGLLYKTSNPTGLNVVKFDGHELAEDVFVFLVDAKRRFAYFNPGAIRDTEKAIRRWIEALSQNPGYKIMVEFPNRAEMLLARAVFRRMKINDKIYARVRSDEQ